MTRRILLLSCLTLLFAGTTGCITGRVAEATSKWRRSTPERLTVTSSSLDEAGASLAVVALEAECRVAPGDPEGGPGARPYTLERSQAFSPDETRFLASKELDGVAVYRPGRDPERASPPGFPDTVLVGEKSGGDGAIYVRTSSGWAAVPVQRYLHRRATKGSKVAATVTEALLLPIAIPLDLATFPIQWLLAPWLPLTPP